MEAISQILSGVGRPQEHKVISKSQFSKPKVIVISGPTGCGKTEMAIELAQAIQGEIISADSMQIYRRMDIGTAKASKKQQELIPHHLIDIRDVSESFNVVDYYYEARKVCEEILKRDHIPIIVGGSGFYIRTFIYGPPLGPPSVASIRDKITSEMDLEGPQKMYEKLCLLDPEYAETITCHDRQKVIRALEIIALTQNKVSALHKQNQKEPLDYDFRCWFIYRPKEELYPRIEKRCDQMLEEGLIDEVKYLLTIGIDQNSSASQSIGYRQTIDFLASPKTENDFKAYLKHLKQATKRFAKRQFTWFRKEPIFRWLNIDLHDWETAIDIILQEYLQH